MLVPRTLAEGKANLSGQESKQIAQDRENNIRERGPGWLKLKRNHEWERNVESYKGMVG